MKYTRKQILKANIKWITEERLKPTNFFTDEQCMKEDVEELAESKTQALIDYINGKSFL